MRQEHIHNLQVILLASHEQRSLFLTVLHIDIHTRNTQQVLTQRKVTRHGTDVKWSIAGHIRRIEGRQSLFHEHQRGKSQSGNERKVPHRQITGNMLDDRRKRKAEYVIREESPREIRREREAQVRQEFGVPIPEKRTHSTVLQHSRDTVLSVMIEHITNI